MPASPPSAIFTSGKNSVVVTGNGTQVQVALTNDSLVPAIAVTDVSFQVGNTSLGDQGADIFSHTTSVFRSDPFGVLGAPLSETVTVGIEDDGAVVSAQFCTIGAGK